MRCRECGLEVDNDKAFCPVCGAPMKVTADYEYIQAEIANKVDRFFNEDHPDQDDYYEGTGQKDSGLDRSPDSVESMAKTKNFYGNDSVFGEDYQTDDYEQDDEFDRDHEEKQPVRRSRRSKSSERSSKPARRILYQKKDQTAAGLITALIILVILAAATMGVLAMLGVFNKNGQNGEQVQNLSVLSCNLEAGETYSAPVTVTINNPQEGNVFYTLDGTEPTSNARIYTGPFEITPDDVTNSYPSVHFRATAYSADSEKTGEINMEIFLEYDEAVAARIVEMQTTTEPETTTALALSAPQISPVAGEYSSDQNILVSSPEGAEIYYTYDGSIPNERSERYVGPVKMKPGVSTFSAICVKDGVVSPVSSYGYNLEYGYPYSSSDAIDRVTNELLWDGYILDYDLYTNDGYVQLTHEGVYEIDGYTYYVIRVDFFGSDGALITSVYRGVGVNYGSIYGIEKDNNNNFYITW